MNDDDIEAGAEMRGLILSLIPQRREALFRILLVLVPAFGLGAGLLAAQLGWTRAPGTIWAVATAPVLIALLVEIMTSLKRGDVGLDVIAALSMTAALFLGEALAAAVVALMYAGGRSLEAYAEESATRSLTALLARAPREAHLERDGEIVTLPIDDIEPGYRLLIRRGDVVPVDGVVTAGVGVLDEAALTGESVPVHKAVGDSVMSGATNAGDAFSIIATRRAADSSFARIVALVEGARRSKAPMSRLADRFALVFLALTIALALSAWAASADPIHALSVLVVATPCPLILAVPVAIISGVSRAAHIGVLVKGGRALEALARIRTVILDKTGTLTEGRARVVGVEVFAALSEAELIRLAASLDQASAHVIAAAIVTAAHERGLRLSAPTDVVEVPGEGVTGVVDGHRVAVGGSAFVRTRIDDGAECKRSAPGAVTVLVGVDGRLAGELTLKDSLRRDAAGTIGRLRQLGIARILLASGDRRDVARSVGSGLGLDEIHGDLSPEQKVEIVRAQRAYGPVLMIGDGVNDAPALAAADLGVAMGGGASGAPAEAADIVILVDDLDRIAPAMRIARRSRAIALQSVVAGVGLSAIAMLFAAFGYLSPVRGALIQECIDVAVILNALRALRPLPPQGGERGETALRAAPRVA